MLEWTNRPVLKTGVLHGTVGSNPTPSSIMSRAVRLNMEPSYRCIAVYADGIRTGVLKGVRPFMG